MFDVKSIDTDAFAESLGLIQTPVLKFVQKEDLENEEEEEEEQVEEENKEQKTGEKKQKKSKLAKLKEKIKQRRIEKLQVQCKPFFNKRIKYC